MCRMRTGSALVFHAFVALLVGCADDGLADGAVGGSSEDGAQEADGASESDGGPDAGSDGSTGDTPEPVVGPAHGTLLVHGGGSIDTMVDEFAVGVGGWDAPVVIIPTALPETDPVFDDLDAYEAEFTAFGFTDVTILHTRDPEEADDPGFYAPLDEASGVYIEGGRQWRLADAYLDTGTLVALEGVLERDGVIAGASAGAVIMGSFLWRGDTLINTILIGDHTEGFAFLEGVAIDVHVAERNRENDLFALIEHDDSLLGLGLDERTWLTINGDELVVAGAGMAYVHHAGLREGAESDEDGYLVLPAGAEYDLAAREEITP